MQKNSLLIYRFDDLQHVTNNFSGFTFTFISSLLHYHEDFYEFILITKGEWRHTIGNSTTILPTGSLLFLKPHVAHIILTESTDNTHLVFGVKKSYFEKFIERSCSEFNVEQMPDCLVKLVSSEKRKYIEHLAKTIHEPSAASHIIADEVLFSCISDFMRSNSSPSKNAYISDIIQKLNSYVYLNESITDICSHYPITRAQLLQQFKKTTGMTIVQYKATQKLAYAGHLLKHTAMPISEMASLLHYDSLSYFIHLFKKTYGMTPSEYRKSDHASPGKSLV